MLNLLQLELSNYREEFDKLYEKLVDGEDFGLELSEIDTETVCLG